MFDDQTTEWASIRIDYHEKDKTPILRGAIAPAIGNLRNLGGEGAILRSHWQDGPHYRLFIRGADPATAAAAVAEEIRAWLAVNPSTTKLEAQDYAKLSLKLAENERITLDEFHLAENNVVTIGDDDPGQDNEVDRVRNVFQEEVLDILIALSAFRSERRRFYLVLLKMMACLGHFSGPAKLEGGHLSFRSHSEAFLRQAPRARKKFDEFKDKFGLDAVESIYASESIVADPEGSADPILRDWVKLLRRVKPQLDEAVRGTPADELARIAGSFDPSSSSFTRALMRGPLGTLQSDPAFISYRILISFFYGILPNLSVRPVDRFALCYVAAEAAEEAYGVDWRAYFGTPSFASRLRSFLTFGWLFEMFSNDRGRKALAAPSKE